MPSLPAVTPGLDVWGQFLVNWLLTAHNADGTHKNTGAAQIPFSHPGVLTAIPGAGRFGVPAVGTIVGVIAAVGTAPTGATVICDVNKNGTTIFTTQANRPTIALSGFVSGPGLSVPNVTSVVVGDLLSVDIDQIGSTVAGADLTVTVLIGT